MALNENSEDTYLSSFLKRSKLDRIKVLSMEASNLEREIREIRAEKQLVDAQIHAFRLEHKTCEIAMPSVVDKRFVVLDEKIHGFIRTQYGYKTNPGHEVGSNSENVDTTVQEAQKIMVKEAINVLSE